MGDYPHKDGPLRSRWDGEPVFSAVNVLETYMHGLKNLYKIDQQDIMTLADTTRMG